MGGLAVGVMAGLGVLGACVWLFLFARLRTLGPNRVRWVRDLPAEAPDGGWPALAVAFAARNEQAAVEAATRSLLAQDYPGLEVIAVDDRSTDATGSILDAIAREDSRLRVVHVRELPPGWLGKNHALQTAAESTTAEWVLLTDADVVFAPGTLRRVLAWAVSNRLDHLTIAPEARTETLPERIFMAMFVLSFGLKCPPWKVIDPRRKESMGVGAFNLVRASAFEAMGGFRRLALSVDDDMRLGQALKFAGYRPGLALGQEAVSVRWQVGMGGMIRGLEKNFFAALNFSFAEVAVVTLGLLTIGVFPYVGVFLGPWWTRAVCAAGVVAVLVLLSDGRGQNGLRWYHGLLLPLGALATLVALYRSIFRTLRDGGVRWRDHLYPLAELKAHVRRRNAWLRELWKSTR